MKVFISHQRRDAAVARRVSDRLLIAHQIPSYLDVVDSRLGMKGEDLADQIRDELSKCTQLLAVVTVNTQVSSWVPWEIGVAAEKEYPLATYSDGTKPYEFLASWPYLSNDADLDKYANESKTADRRRRQLIAEARGTLDSVGVDTQRAVTREFYKALRRSLNQ
jgi:hypothetical protein